MHWKKPLVLLTAFAVLASVQVAAAATWNIDTTHSSVGFKVRHFFSKVPGEFTNFAGTLQFDPNAPEKTVVEVEIDPGSISTNNDKRDGHLRSEDFFFVEKYPTMVYRSTGFKKDGDHWLMTGMLTMRGVEKPVDLKVEFLGSGTDGWGGQRAGFTASGELNRKEFGINWNKALDHGGAMLSDEVEILIEIEAVEAKEEAGE